MIVISTDTIVVYTIVSVTDICYTDKVIFCVNLTYVLSVLNVRSERISSVKDLDEILEQRGLLIVRKQDKTEIVKRTSLIQIPKSHLNTS